MKSDRELLELAAKAAGMNWRDWTPMLRQGELEPGLWPYDWNPLTDDGDALRAAAKRRISINFDRHTGMVHACYVIGANRLEAAETLVALSDGAEAARRAVTRALAAIGEAMP